MRTIAGALAVSLALVAAYLALGGASYAPAKVADPCAPRDWRLPQGFQEVAEQMGYQISGYRLDFYGLCPTCLADGRGCRHPSRISCTGATLSSRAIHR